MILLYEVTVFLRFIEYVNYKIYAIFFFYIYKQRVSCSSYIDWTINGKNKYFTLFINQKRLFRFLLQIYKLFHFLIERSQVTPTLQNVYRPFDVPPFPSLRLIAASRQS